MTRVEKTGNHIVASKTSWFLIIIVHRYIFCVHRSLLNEKERNFEVTVAVCFQPTYSEGFIEVFLINMISFRFLFKNNLRLSLKQLNQQLIHIENTNIKL